MVPAEDLRSVLDDWCRRYLAARDPIYQKLPWGKQSQVMGPWSWLERESGVSSRRMWEIRRGATQHVTLHVADRILTAMDMPEALQDGTVRVIRNPRMTEEGWREAMLLRGCDPLESLA